jgi:putative DNA primase/helicase
MKLAKRATSNSSAGAQTADPGRSGENVRLDWALYYLRCGLSVVRTNGKVPPDKGWQNSQAGEAELQAWFGAGADHNIGVITGERSHNLADIDLDIPAAVAVADMFLPKTGWIFGRPSHPRSHRLYRADQIGETLKLKDPLTEKKDGEKAVIVELRGNGCQTVFPPSRHPSGEMIDWDKDFTEPASVNWNDLAVATYRIAIAALLTRYWPGEGGRHEAAKALGGALAHTDYLQEDAEKLIEVVTRAAGDSEVADRVRAVADSYRNHQAGEKVTGWPTVLV